MINTKINGRQICLYLSGQAMFELDDVKMAWNDGHTEPVLNVQEILLELDSERVQVLAEVVEILERAALAAKRALGQDVFEIVTAGQILALAKPKDVLILNRAALKTIIEGYATDAENDEPVDVFMIENLKKKINEEAEPST